MTTVKTPASPPRPMTVAAFLDWQAAAGQDNRYELIAGDPVPMPAEAIGHVEVKYAVWLALCLAVRRAGLTDCHVLGDGATVRIDADTAYEPGALVYGGPPLPADEKLVPEPLMVVEVASPGSVRVDAGAKLEGYFRLPSLRHYVLVHPVRRSVVHHERQGDGTIRSRVLGGGNLTLDPPGFAVEIEDLFSLKLP